MNSLKYVLPEVVLLENVKFLKIPGYVSAYSGEDGSIVYIKSDGTLFRPKPFEWKTSKGTYLYVKIVNDQFFQVTKAIHQLACLTWNGPHPNDTFIYEPNHKNGNKHDNRPVNLEWLNRSKNVQHAYDSGLCTQGIRVQMVDVETKEVKDFHTVSALARVLGMPRHQFREICARHRDKPYQGKYLFILDDSSDRKVSRIQCQEVIFKDYVTGQITITRSALEAADLTHVNSGTIVFRINKCKLETQNQLLSRYVFKKLTSDLIWPEYSAEEALRSEQVYTERREKQKTQPPALPRKSGD